MATLTWYGDGGGSRGTKGLDVYIGGTQIPSTATISSIKFTVCISVDKPAGTYAQLYYLRTTDYMYFIGGSSQEYGEGGSYVKRNACDDFSNHGYYDGDDGVEYSFTTNMSYFVGKSGAWLNVRVNNSGSGTSYVRGLTLTFTYTDNTPPNPPVINYPIGGYTYNTKPYFKATTSTDAQNHTQYLGYAIKKNSDGSWPVPTVWLSTALSANEALSWRCGTALEPQTTYTLYCYSKDYSGATNGSDSAPLNVWKYDPEVTAGSLATYNSIISRLVEANNDLVGYYGKGTSQNYPSSGSLADDALIDAIETSLEKMPHTSAISSVNAGTKLTASHVNSVWAAIELA